ncbi:TIGR02466 family protein [Amphritea sp. 1_MG-2023]|uniref:TIGR02466 family protein n=1 Tax=Amphritea sp. 1_MG-2023 TaxID=3062670 RepID=UPI0026E19214|nr:TIGR02466 family protein [Amphritea sp. 1_MG-2023]MDO6562939.1 TIGR02466 family protein [Amphritea sp. 1_MG-2023]
MNQPDILIEDISVWETQMFTVQNPLHSDIRESLLKLIYQLRDQQQQAIESEVAPTAKHALYESSLDLLQRSEPVIAELREFIEDMLVTVASAVNEPFWPEGAQASAEIVESWFHITENGGYHDTHSHPNCSWCGIYYIDAGESDIHSRNGINRFYDPRHGADQYLDAGTAYLNSTGSWDFSAVEGQVVIFPSYLKHAAMPYFSQKDRVIIAFNSQIHFQA